MDFEESRIYRSLVQEPFHKVAGRVLRWTEEGRDVTYAGDDGRGYLHVVADLAEKFRDPRAVPAVYQLSLAGIDVNRRDVDGNTALHGVVKGEGVFRIVVALLRCGADPSLKNNEGQTAEDVLRAEAPGGWEETLYWLRKYSPGLPKLLEDAKPDTDKLSDLLSSWCRLYVSTPGGGTESLVDRYRSRENWDESVVDMLERHVATNELAMAVMAGSPQRIRRAASKGGDVNTADQSYRYHYQHAPEVPQPLLAAAWEQDNYDVIDAVMSLSPDTGVLYSNYNNRTEKPVLFHIISGRPRPENHTLIHRVLRGADLSKRNHKGQTVLFEAIDQKLPVAIFKDILTYSVDLSARDAKARSARDYAAKLGYDDYVRAIDHHVIQMVDNRRDGVIATWAARAYDHVTDVVSAELAVNERLKEKLEGNRLYKTTAECLSKVSRTQRLCRLLMEAADQGDVDTIEKHATDRHVIECQNPCGHTLLHRAIMAEKADAVVRMLAKFDSLVDIPDNLQRYPLHYANLFFGPSHEVSLALRAAGAKDVALDISGRAPDQYSQDTLTTHQYNTLLKEVTEFESEVFLRMLDFDCGLSRAIKAGDSTRVRELIHQAGLRVDMAAHSQSLFDCVDQGQPDIAVYLLQNGCDPDVWKQYEKCEPTSDPCALSRCQHPVVSLYDRCVALGYDELAQYIKDLRTSKVCASSSLSTQDQCN